MKRFGRMLDQGAGTLRELDVEGFDASNVLDVTPDLYAHEHVNMDEGDVAFVEVASSVEGPWELWRVECIFRPVLGKGFVTTRATLAEASAERELS